MDCQDGSDEDECTPAECAQNEFTCGNGHCIPAAYKCDMDNDCGDGSDEADCGKLLVCWFSVQNGNYGIALEPGSQL